MRASIRFEGSLKPRATDLSLNLMKNQIKSE